MDKVKFALNPAVTKLILESYPVMKRRTALWFFTNELKKAQQEKSRNFKKINGRQMRDMWKNMNPEDKRKYFNMAGFDDVRYKEQRSLWIAKVGSLIGKSEEEIEKLAESMSNRESKEKEVSDLLERCQKNYQKMIQTESTKMLYRDMIDKTENLKTNVTSQQLISAVPKHFRPILERPRRPACPFLLFAHENKEQIMIQRSSEQKSTLFLKYASMLWNKMNEEEQSIYRKKYKCNLDDYNIAMKQFNNSDAAPSLTYLNQAIQERKRFTKSLRRRLRKSAMVPLNVRNAFNFFLMANRNLNVTESSRIWRELPDDEREKYEKMEDDDRKRYYDEKTLFEGFIESLHKSINKADHVD